MINIQISRDGSSPKHKCPKMTSLQWMRHQKFINKETSAQVVYSSYTVPHLSPSLHFSYPQRGGNKSLGKRRKGKSYRLLGLSLRSFLCLEFPLRQENIWQLLEDFMDLPAEWACPDRNTYVYAMSSSSDSGLSFA